jgi:hypothetical protein
MISKRKLARDRIVTPATTASFFSFEGLRAASRYKFNEIFENESQLESSEDCFQKVLELYFKVDEKTSKVNEICIELLKREITLNQLKSVVKDKSREVQVDEAEKSLHLLKEDQELDLLESEIKDLEFLVENKETENKKDEQLIKEYIEELKKSKKGLEEKKKIIKIYKKLEDFEKKLKEEFLSIKVQKDKILEKFLSTKNQFSSNSLNFQEISRKRSELPSHRPIQEKIQSTRSSISSHLSEIESKTSKNQSLAFEVANLEKNLKEKLHNFTIRKNWLQDSQKTLESKSAIARFTTKQLETRRFSFSNNMSLVQSCFEDLDQMEARLEAQEMKQLLNETSVKGEILHLVKTVKKKMSQKSVLFC